MRSTLVALATVAAAACASTPLADPMLAAPDGTSWRLATLRGAPVLGSTIATLTFERDHVFGTGGTNRFFGGWSVDGDRLTFSKVGSSTRMRCWMMPRWTCRAPACSTGSKYRRAAA